MVPPQTEVIIIIIIFIFIIIIITIIKELIKVTISQLRTCYRGTVQNRQLWTSSCSLLIIYLPRKDVKIKG